MHEWTLGATINKFGINSRLYSQYLVVDQILTYCLEHNIQHIFFGGDWFHTFNNLSAITVHWAVRAVQLLTDNNIQVYLNDGNHDHANKSGTYTSLTMFQRPYCYVNAGYVFDVCGLKVKMIGYKEDRDVLLREIEHEHVDLLFLHQGVSGEPMPSGFVIPNEILKADDIPTDTVCWTGHYHNHKRISNNLTIIGAATQLTWGDAGQVRGWLDYDTDTGKLIHVESEAPKFFNEPPIDIDVAGHFVRTKAGVMVDDKAAYIQVLPDAEEPVTIHDMKLPEDMSPLALVKQYASHAKLDTDLTATGVALVKGEYEIKDTRTK
jgi:DNA repair exonuclease SbcCD nuclease subunit